MRHISITVEDVPHRRVIFSVCSSSDRYQRSGRERQSVVKQLQCVCDGETLGEYRQNERNHVIKLPSTCKRCSARKFSAPGGGFR